MSENKTIFLGNETLRILYPNKLFFSIQDNNESDWERINIDIKIKEFYKYTSIPVILNTSFNVKGQPIVNTPTQAIDTFLGTNIDILVIGDYILKK